MKPTTNLLEECAVACKTARAGLLHAASLLYVIREKELFLGQYNDFSEYVEDACQMDKSQASRLLKVYEHFCIQNSVEPAQLESVNPERLYVALSLPGSIESQITKARTLTRSELRAEKNDEEPHEHTPISICSTCHIRIYEEGK